MDIRNLKYFRHLAGTLHFGKTSRACNITPSALTRMIQRLENEVGKPLFNRDNRTVELTAAGELLMQYAEEVLQSWKNLQNALTHEENLQGSLSLYGSVTAVYSILPGILTAYRKKYSRVQINLETGDAAMALTRLQNRDVDIVIAALPAEKPAGTEVIKITETPLVFIAPVHFPETIIHFSDTKHDNRYSNSDHNIDWQQTPLIIADRGLSREGFDLWLAKENISPTIYAQVAGNEAIIAMVSLGCGVGVVPQLVLDKSPLKKDVRVLKSAPRLKPFSIGVCTMKKGLQNPRIAAFWEIAHAGG
ncbi:DNA-binding transcriptional dual regulator [Desulfamplus magnetovallimortis]|uniref:DNA-binding transcriptional dual regulator n=1 Tax=Desulfamplus magnetovallimortis TaxID=1246637 RepID=A0A1W1HAK3_9BACT|nr:HTH-type transcriptional activator IlvY [Desulfamplus magnetovallimortis]SLM29473.1 DNA-binding transcriptional dual regulator [Desulfamplus magnetovallimortis]